MTDVHEAPATDKAGGDGDRPQVHDLRSALELLKQVGPGSRTPSPSGTTATTWAST